MVDFLLIKFFMILLVSGQGLVCLFSFFSLIFISHTRKKFKDGFMREMVDNLLTIAFVTYLFTFFNILIENKFVKLSETMGDLILNIFVVLILIMIIKTTVDIVNETQKHTSVKTRKKR